MRKLDSFQGNTLLRFIHFRLDSQNEEICQTPDSTTSDTHTTITTAVAQPVIVPSQPQFQVPKSQREALIVNPTSPLSLTRWLRLWRALSLLHRKLLGRLRELSKWS